MKRELKDRWLADLRSGEYVQGTGSFEYEEAGQTRTCCLGVLCHSADVPVCGYDPDRDNYEFVESEEALSWDQARSLWHKNDVDRATFYEIADWIEANVHAS